MSCLVVPEKKEENEEKDEKVEVDNPLLYVIC